MNYTINDSIPSFKNFVLPLAREKAPGIEQNYFQTLFNTVIFDKFIPGGNLYFSVDIKAKTGTLYKLYDLLQDRLSLYHHCIFQVVDMVN
ncbi:hypothetical protein ONA00_05160 [Mycoplasmopsis cynos]|uniref:hypothetical protein n=1 Tax=Mycoplasmopsis cynos TaxID=171284 RepID=UPI0024CDD2FB|nr:hypothetical protein [Mycoplasmopsis cynos]WAM10705.1 hypothetical protein ONA00_05160 [Mycoplasmopsis cynos]